MKKILISLLLLIAILSLCACGNSSTITGNFGRMNAAAESVFSEEHLSNEPYSAAYRDFSYRFFQTIASDEDGNFCLSPLSAYMAFSLCFYGSDGATAEEFAETFGLTKAQAADYCSSLYAHYMQRDYSDENTAVHLANSVWIDNAVASYVKQSYLDGATGYYDAAIYRCDFGDPQTVNAINGWCSDNTDGLIDKIIDRLDKDQIMALINALLVELVWREQYLSGNVVTDDFRNADDTTSKAEYLARKITTCYLSEDAKAFKMPLADGFSFVGILPNEDISVADYCASLTSSKVDALLSAPSYEYDVYTRIPKYTLDYEIDLIEPMMRMGLRTAFNVGSANFRSLAEIPGKNVYIGEAIQKTHFELDEKGIKAAAITYIGMKATSSIPFERKKINIYLDRPFVYLLMDDKTGLPLFIGRINRLGK